MKNYSIKPISRKEAEHYILEIHYAKRWPVISYYFGLFKNEQLVGVCTYGPPASPWLCKGVCGEKYRKQVIELNRLALLNNLKNEASFLIGNSLKMLPEGMIVVSYADTAQGHVGVVYKATNWLYTGATKPRTDMASKTGGHSRHHSGDRTNRVFRSSKHRFVTFTGNKKQKKELRKALKYPVTEYV